MYLLLCETLVPCEIIGTENPGKRVYSLAIKKKEWVLTVSSYSY